MHLESFSLPTPLKEVGVGGGLLLVSISFPLYLDALPNFSPISLRRKSPPYAVCVQLLIGCLWL